MKLEGTNAVMYDLLCEALGLLLYDHLPECRWQATSFKCDPRCVAEKNLEFRKKASEILCRFEKQS